MKTTISVSLKSLILAQISIILSRMKYCFLSTDLARVLREQFRRFCLDFPVLLFIPQSKVVNVRVLPTTKYVSSWSS